MKEVAIITGASGGIGYEIALLFAKRKIDVLIVARNKQKLNDIKLEIEQQFKINVYCVATDLSISDGLVDIDNCVKSNNLSVTYLVNNAGFGDYGFFTERSMEKYSEMLGLNVFSLTELTYYYAKQMIKNGKGKILNVASTAGIQPDPYFAVYGASKAYVISLTEAIHKEFEKTGVTATVLSPGATKTEFMERADMNNAKLYDSGVMSAKEVAEVGFKGMMKGKLHVIPGFKNRILAFFSSITPSSKLRLNMAAKVMASK
ncbi:MAG: SDR family oxidoreductase [Sphingobacteriales bacterium]|jgi:short-subunit dehydrogenase|nr:SDR family oxidoreductase [Sphingobacteriales bacterium]